MGESANEKLGVATLTPEELQSMADIQGKSLFNREYGKSDSVLDLMKLFGIPDTKKNRRFCLAVMAYGGASESAKRKLEQILECISEMVPEVKK